MRKNIISYLVIITLLVLTSIFSINVFLQERSAHDKFNINSFPKIVGDWKGTDQKVTEEEYKMLETRNLIAREYTNSSGQKLSLFIIYSETNRSVFHPPEVCLIGEGITIVDKKTDTIGSGKSCFSTNKLFLEKGENRQMVLYSYKAGKLYTENFYLQQIYLIAHQMFGKRVPGATIRVTMPLTRDEKYTLTTLKDFLSKTRSIIDSLT